jgi:hypothetical protein
MCHLTRMPRTSLQDKSLTYHILINSVLTRHHKEKGLLKRLKVKEVQEYPSGPRE